MKTTIKHIIHYLESRKYILLFSILYFLIRLVLIDSYFFLRDERDLFLTALSLAHTGKDLYGNIFPLVFSRISPQAPLLGMYWVVPFIAFFHITSPLFVKILYLLPTLFFPVLIFELVLSIVKERKVSFITALVVAFSPWYFHISRLGLEAHLAYFFCLLGLILYLKKQRTMAYIFLIASYFSYFGIRPVLLLLIPYIELVNLIQMGKKAWKTSIVSVVVFIILFSGVFFLGSHIEQTSSRSTAEVIFLNKEKLSLETNFLRSIADVPFLIRGFFDNKVSVILHTVFYNFFKGIDFSYLFFSGDYVAIYSNQVTGQFFPFLFVFFILGICSLAKKNRHEYYLMASFSLIGLVSSLINSYSLTFSIRSIISLVGIGFICSLGILYVFELLKHKKWKYYFLIGILFIYTIFSTLFTYKYLFQNYHTTNSIFNEQERYIASYSKEHNVQTIIVPNIHSYFLSYLSTLSLSSSVIQHVQIQLNKADGYVIDGHRFIQCKGEQMDSLSVAALSKSTLVEVSCLSAKARLSIDLNMTEDIIKLQDTEYKNMDINRNTKYYFFR